MTGITAACTCSVDGRSGWADTRHSGYSFTGCGAHVAFHDPNGGSGGGYERPWCYVTSPPDCPGGSPYIPEGFKTENTLPEWEAKGAAWKECHDGYRCEAWWGSLEGAPEGEPVMLDAPLDWPDGCALCTNSNGGDADGTDDEQSTASAGCVGWSFHPSTGSCQLMSAVDSVSRDSSWRLGSTVHGYPGYFEAPLHDCWARTEDGLCINTNVALIIPGIFLAVLGLIGCYAWATRPLSHRSALLRELTADPESRLVKAACVQVTAMKVVKRTRKGRPGYLCSYSGTFVTRDDALLVVPPTPRRREKPNAGPDTEQKMLKVLFSTNLSPRADPAVADNCETQDGLRVEFSKMCKAARTHERRSSRGTNTISSPAVDRRFDCLLLVGATREGESHREGMIPKVLLVGILGEDRITYGVNEANEDEPVRPDVCGFSCLVPAIVLLVTLCITLLTNDAAQNMAAWTFVGDSKVGAAVGLVLCVSFTVLLGVWLRRRHRSNARLVEEWPLVAESGPPSRSIELV